MQRIIGELKDAGYATLKAARSADGRLGGRKWTISELPSEDSQKALDLTDNRDPRQSGKPSIGKGSEERLFRPSVFPTVGKPELQT